MTLVIRNSQLYGFNNNSSIGKICVAKCEEENGEIIIIQGIGIAMKTSVVFNIIVKKIKLKHPNLTSQILPECKFSLLSCGFKHTLFFF
jgi:hypothetical protein